MHIGFGQNTVSSLYGHQKGDHMKTIELSHKKHKANESQEKMTVTSGKDVCRRIGHSDEADGENQENAYIHDRFALDAGYANYIRETVPKTTWSKDYLQELWDEETKYLKSIRESKNGYGFDDIGMGAAYAYSTMYQKIVEGYRNGTRELGLIKIDNEYRITLKPVQEFKDEFKSHSFKVRDLTVFVDNGIVEVTADCDTMLGVYEV